MIKIGILSDSHGKDENIRKFVCEIEKKNIDLIFHLGDLKSDCEIIKKYTNKKIYSVLGNCDYMSSGNMDLLLNIEGIKFFLTHGHKYGVKYSLNNIYYKAKELNADVVLFGHTHSPFIIKEKDLEIINPGSLSFPRGKLGKSYAVITVNGNAFESFLYEI
ncbi:metallophosphoesterase [Helicovermis profundi]|uniref:Phosphoesterase n=1 Tax=Helicovermis profundi TaxID=3065157 RepID=A0AAU9E5E5_9FIRM|nr:metallophosphoesterase [Clostridia bacterium S502]